MSLPLSAVRLSTRRLFGLVLLAAILAGSCFADRVVAQSLAFRVYGEAEGLNNAYFSCLHQDRTGYVFVCTEHGLYAYDGQRYVNLGPQQGLPDGGIASSLAFDAGNRLVIRYPNSIFVSTTPTGPHTPPAALVFRAARSMVGPILDNGTNQIVPWHNGAVFAGPHALYAVDTGDGTAQPRVEFADTAPRRSDKELQPSTPLVAAGPVVWAVRADGAVCGFLAATERCFGPAEGLPADAWVALLRTADGHVMARSPTRLAEIDPATGRVEVSRLPFQGGRYANYQQNLLLALTPSGDVLTQFADGLMIRDRSGWKTLGTANGLPPVAILTLMFDRQGDLWLGGLGRGVMRALGYGDWRNFDHRDGLASDMLWQMARQPHGPLWVASDGGIDAIDSPADAVPARRHFDEAAFSIALDGFHHLWRSAGSNAVACITLGSGDTVRYPLPQVSRILQGPGSRLWFITLKGVYAADGAVAPSAPRPVPGLDGPMTTAVVARDGSLWLLRGRELLHRHADGRVVPVEPHWQQRDFAPLTLAAGPDGTIWTAGAGGLYRLRLDDDRVVSISRFESPTVISNSIVSLLVDSRGWVWAGTDLGVSAFNGKAWVSVNMAGGLIWNDQNQGGLLEDTDGSMWFATSNGLSHLPDPAVLFAVQDPRPVITSVSVGDARYRERATPFTREPFFIQFGTLDFRADAVMRFRFRLDGVDAGWADTASSYARYPSVPPGHHRFELVAYNPLTHQNSAPVSILLRIRRPWWLWWPLLLLDGLAVIGIAYAGLRLRFRFLVEQKRVLQREVDLRTAEIRDAQATDSLTGLLTRGEVQSRLVAALSRADRTRQITIGLLDIDHFKCVNDRFGHLAGDEILQEMGRRLKQALGPGEYAGRYGGEEILIVLEADLAPEAARIARLNAAACGRAFEVEGEPIAVTCSVGVSHEHDGDTWKSLIGRADKALYRAKAEGRDRIVLCGLQPAD